MGSQKRGKTARHGVGIKEEGGSAVSSDSGPTGRPGTGAGLLAPPCPSGFSRPHSGWMALKPEGNALLEEHREGGLQHKGHPGTVGPWPPRRTALPDGVQDQWRELQ